MENIPLAKLVLKTAETEFENETGLFNMLQWGVQKPCGTAACLAGHTLLQHGGYELAGPHVFRRTADGQYFAQSAISWEAQRLLGMSREERKSGGHDIFYNFSNELALDTFRTLIAESEVTEE